MSEITQGTEHFVLACTPRSASAYRAVLLTGMGVPCGHEDVYHILDIRDWGPWEGDSSYMCVPFLKAFPGPRVLVVREPIKTINSMLREGVFHFENIYSAFNEHHMPSVYAQFTKPEDRAMHFWSRWNLWASENADVVLRQEDINDDPGLLLKAVDRDGDVSMAEFVPHYINKRAPKIAHNGITWDDLSDEVVKTARDFGYE